MLLTALALVVIAQPPLADEELILAGIGPHKRPISTQSAKAQQFFDQGLNLLYAFNQAEAKRAFRASAKYDPQSPMSWWGLAMANGPHINNMMVMPEEEQEAVDSLKKAMANLGRAKPAERALIKAAMVRFQVPAPKDRGPHNAAFAKEMRKVWRQFPKDADIGALFAESMMDLRPWDLWLPNGTPQPGTIEVVGALERVNRLNPNHPLGLHLYIHAVEASPHPERARDEADRLRDLQPGLGHNVHMPSHLDVRVGDWHKAIVSNTKAVAADKEYRTRRPEQFIYRIYMAHNHHMLAFAAMMLGQNEKATAAIDTMIAEMPDDFQVQAAPFIDGFFAMPFEVRKRFGRWDEVLAMPDLPDHFPLSRTVRYAARAVSYAAKGMPQEARAEQQHFYAARKKVPAGAAFGQNSAAGILSVAHHLMNGEILVAEGKTEAAVEQLRLAVAGEDRLRYSEPPDWIQPTRHTLGALLLKASRNAEAVEVYREDLRRLPNNGWSLYGLAAGLDALGKTAEAAKVRVKFDEVWADADTSITSSCICIPGKH